MAKLSLSSPDGDHRDADEHAMHPTSHNAAYDAGPVQSHAELTEYPEIAISNQEHEEVVSLPNELPPTDACEIVAAPTRSVEPRKRELTLTAPAVSEFLLDSGMQVFLDQFETPFAWLPVGEPCSHRGCLPLNGVRFRAWLLKLIKKHTESFPKKRVLKQIIDFLEMEAYIHKSKTLVNRFAAKNGRLFIDIGDRDWHMIVVTKDGWRIESQSKPMFYRPSHQRPLVKPERGGNSADLFKFIRADNEQWRLLILTWLVACLCSDIQTPILIFMGQHGAAKSTLTLWLRSIIDPSESPILGETRIGELSRLFQLHAVPCFENMSHFTRLMADAFCRATTGNSVDQRKLYTDSDSVLRRYRRPIVINAMDTPSMRPDFLDRSIVVDFPRLKKYKSEKNLTQEFEVACPRLLGALLDLTVQALRFRDNTPAPTEFRMVDFAHLGRSVARAIGKTPGDFDAAYRLNIQQRDVEMLDASPVTRLIKRLASSFGESAPWTGTMTELLSCLEKVAIDTDDRNARKDLPKSDNWLSRRISELAPALVTDGIVIEPLLRTNKRRPWRLFKNISTLAQDASDAVRKETEGGDSHE